MGMTSTGVDQLREELQQISTDSGNVGKLMLTNLNIYSPVFLELLCAMCRNRVQATDQSLRLVDGSSNEGRLEVYIDEEWTTVGSVGWTPFNADVACNQLGFSAGQNMYKLNMTSYHRRVGVSDIRCSGNETSLMQCSHDPVFHVDTSCDHRMIGRMFSCTVSALTVPTTNHETMSDWIIELRHLVAWRYLYPGWAGEECAVPAGLPSTQG